VSEQLTLPNPDSTDALGRKLAAAVLDVKPESFCVYLRGELGAGKTSLTRALLRGLGHEGRVPSPTYTLVEPYAIAGYRVYHLDLYRLQAPGELEFLGISELAEPGSLLLIEWPENGGDQLCPANLEVFLQVIPEGRVASLEPKCPQAERVVQTALR
jgi:tRNA threonylcarbamoyladenosine biosynthesis protein TsaE